MTYFISLFNASFLFLTLYLTLADAATFDIRNNCPYTVWAAAVPGGGRRLDRGQNWPLNVNPGTKAARIWARTNCQFDGAGRGRCQTGDCGGLLQCQAYGSPPNTLAEFALNQFQNLDFIDISNIDGFNVPMEFSSVSGGCNRVIRCTADIVGQCPNELRVPGGCNGPCPVFKTEEHCCNSGKCGPTKFSRFFKERCPDAYSYPKDDATSVFTCPGGTNYKDLTVKRKKNELELVVAVCWAIWYSRNRLVFEGKEEDPKNSVARAIAMVESYRRIKVPNEQNSPGHSRISQLEWANPPKGCYKVNVDAAINVSNQKAGLGVVIRNSVGKVVAAAVQGAPYRGDVACMEAEAVLFGIQSAQQAAVFPIIIESDSKEVVDLSLKKKISKTEIEWKIAEIQANLENQNVSSLSYVPRSCNSIAHSFAKIALGFESQVFWLENFPEHIRCTLAKFIN